MITVLGDVLLDRDVDGDVRRLAPDAPVPVVDHERTVVRPGGAGLAAVLVARGGHAVTLVTALAGDEAGEELRELLAASGVTVVDVGQDGATPEKIRVRTDGRALLRLDRGGDGGAVGPATLAARGALRHADAVLVADYGRGVAREPGLRDALADAIAGGVPVVWDPHPRGPAPVPGVALVTPNDAEAKGFSEDATPGPHGAITRAEQLRATWESDWVCVTRGADGAVAVGPDGPAVGVAADHVPVGDPCGAGDRFASRAAEILAAGGTVPDAVRAAVAAASSFVASGGAASLGHPGSAGTFSTSTPNRGLTPFWGSERLRASDVVAATRSRGGTVVATGGCFDLLHAGHVRTLQDARALGDCLVVCLNADASVKRLKGPSRPLQDEVDRAAVLLALGCVDAVEVFAEDTPVEALRRLQPDVWVKGGDYAAADLPETPVLAAWGGRAVILPFVEGRSTTRLIEDARLHAV